MALHLLHGSPAAAQGSRSAPGSGSSSYAQPGVSREWQVGEVLDVTLPDFEDRHKYIEMW